ncbi:2-hydroxyacid dehydrogenase [Fictibacillus phosphorivorans]|uniref:2-hydroxyacid dehydrogenase n=1 Tax=Fictibacillus phosphorivorans TaxID=1221500 RepID=UPI00203CA518|nr:D-glycerate dehydrogenase [Fictibacillus phosphorivorans]MCM3718782.1 D-glycerate dehydrogenase [Fictibacillus phosphorivorans]MCM3776405.1 D-glycerate dehydrogenase [Fictibacillus phosphorivorans]
MQKPYVYVTRKLPEETLKKLKEIAEVGMWPHEEKAVPREVLLKEAQKAEGLLTMLSDKVDGELLDKAESLKVVANLAVGYDNIDIQKAKENNITVCNTPDVLTDSTADLAFSLILASARRLVESANYVKEGKWNSWGPLLLAGADVHHKTIGIVGMGRIGEAVARRAKGFDMNILYHNRNRKHDAEKNLGATYKDFYDLLKESDFVVCLAPLTEETRGMFNREAFQAMKKSAIFINAGRGASVDEEALVDALQNGTIAGAGLDVFVKEPIAPDHPLLSMNQVVALPHIGSASVETRMKMAERACRNIGLILEGKAAETPVG